MRWAPVLIFAYLVVGLQAGLAGQISVHGAEPNFGLLAIVFIAINGPREPALLACVVIGGMQDLATQQAPGLFALSYGLAGWVICEIQQVVYQDHPLTHAVLTLFAGVLTAIVVYVHGRVVTPRVSLVTVLGTAVFSALLAPLVIWVLNALRPLFGFATKRRKPGY